MTIDSNSLSRTGRWSNLQWKINRLRTMDIKEVLWRSRRSARIGFERFWISLGLAPNIPNPDSAYGNPWISTLPTGFDQVDYTQAGERILSGRFDVFALRSAELGFPPDWNRDPKTGTRAPMSFGKTLNYRAESEVGDIKYVWEPNRHFEIVTLSQAFYLSGDVRFAVGARDLLVSWFRQCPYPWGPNWTSALEHAVRLVNWAYAWQFLGGGASQMFRGEQGKLFKRQWLETIFLHLHFIRGHLSRFSSANNHLLGEYMGLFIGTTVWPLWKETREWNALAKHGLETETFRQIGRDGVHLEQATWYEHEVADMLLHCGLFGRANGIEFDAKYWQRFISMLEHLASVMDASGHVPMFGDSDDAVIVRLSQEPDFNPYHSLLATGAVMFNRGDFKAKAGRFDDKSRWLLGDEGAVQFEALKGDGRGLPVRRAFESGGYWILGDKLESADEIRLVADAGDIGYLSIAAHGHADALSFTLSVRGREILIDPGTYSYHTQKRWRDYFRGTSAHNTLRVARQDQSVMGGNFLWLTHAHAQCHRFDSSKYRDVWEASHDGYLRLDGPVRHRRKLVLEKEIEQLEVIDWLEGAGQHFVELFWHFPEACIVKRSGTTFEVVDGDVKVQIHPPGELSARLVVGAESPPLGWVSPRFDEITPSTTLLCEGAVQAGTMLYTYFRIGR